MAMVGMLFCQCGCVCMEQSVFWFVSLLGWLVCMKQSVRLTAAMVAEGIASCLYFDSCYKLLYSPFFQTVAISNSLLGGAGNQTRDILIYTYAVVGVIAILTYKIH